MKPGDLVRHNGKLGVFIGLKTYDGNYTCSEVYMMEEKEVRPIQSDLLKKVEKE